MAEWGVDAFKVDGCNANVSHMKQTYPALGAALNQSGRPMVYSCSWPDYERSLSVPVNFSLVAEVCNSWRIFWDVQAGQYAHTQAQKYDCANGVMEFYASGSTMAGAEFSPHCPGDCAQHPKPIDHDAMVAAAGPGSWNDAGTRPHPRSVPATRQADSALSVRHAADRLDFLDERPGQEGGQRGLLAGPGVVGDGHVGHDRKPAHDRR